MKKKIRIRTIIFIIVVILPAVVLFVLLGLFGCNDKDNNSEYRATKESTPENINYEELAIGDTAPDFSVELLSGKTVNLSDYRGKLVFINFWATWCGPCVNEMPDIQKLADAFPDDLVVLAINCSEKKEKVEDFINNKGFTFHVGLDGDGKIQKKYPTMGIPYTVILDADGVVSAIHLGASGDMFSVYEKDVNAALGK